jgi:peptidoglycan/xylan/chitin deacetylase (PgdA/CDA1 family)
VRSVALTFDAGADRGYAASILRTLERNHIPASFGMTGKWAQANPDLVKRMARDRDSFVNHTFDHRSFTGLSTRLAPLTPAQRTWEIQQTERIVHRLTGATTKPYFRPPFGDWDSATLALAGRLGYSFMVMWTIDSLGWEHLSAPAILQRCLSLMHPGSIVLMHVGIQSHDAQALQPLVDSLRARAYRFVTVPELVSER